MIWMTLNALALNLIKRIRVNVIYRASNFYLVQTSSTLYLGTVITPYPTTEKNHPVTWVGNLFVIEMVPWAIKERLNEVDKKNIVGTRKQNRERHLIREHHSYCLWNERDSVIGIFIKGFTRWRGSLSRKCTMDRNEVKSSHPFHKLVQGHS